MGKRDDIVNPTEERRKLKERLSELEDKYKELLSRYESHYHKVNNYGHDSRTSETTDYPLERDQ